MKWGQVEKHPHSNIRIILDKMAARAGAAYKQLMARLANLNLDPEPDPRTVIVIKGGSGSAYSYCDKRWIRIRVQLLKKRLIRFSIEIPE
jgi:hypothetical protein